MKFPFDLSLAFVFRMIFPGVLLAAAFVPLIHTIVQAAGYDVPLDIAFPVEAIVWGWLVVLADQPIYMLYEGRRYWPAPLREFFQAREQRRLDRLRQRAADDRAD